jgi:outer membrane protein assembly factor BamB
LGTDPAQFGKIFHLSKYQLEGWMMIKNKRNRVGKLFLIALMALGGGIGTQSHAQTDNWPRFRGPNGTGVSDATTIPTKFSEGDFNWKVQLPGEGHGSAVVWGNKIFVMCASKRDARDNAKRTLACLSAADGKILWTRSFDTKPYRKYHKLNNYGTTTPAVDAEQVYTYWASDRQTVLAAFDHQGNEKWRRDIGPFVSNHGGGTSPMVYKDMVIITNDQDGKAFLLAVDKKTGKKRWQVERKVADNGASYGLPPVYQPQGQKAQLVFASKANGLTGVEADSGKVIWELAGVFHLRVVAGPVIAGDIVMSGCGSGGSGHRFIGARIGSSDKAEPAKEIYRKEKRVPYVTTPVVYKGMVYYVTDDGYATCMDPATGKAKWQEKFPKGTSFFCSLVCINGNIYIVSKKGEVFVFKASPDKFELLGKSSLGELSYATPAVANGRMYLRTLNHLISVGGK